MNREEIKKTIEVWGVMIPFSPSGRRKWPTEIKAMACEQIRSGRKIKDIALEIGANPSLVAKWKDQVCSNPSDGFVEIIRADEGIDGHLNMTDGVAAFCDIYFSDTKIAVPVGYPSQHLVDILRAVRESR